MAQRYVYDYLLTPMERQLLHEDVANSLEHLWADSVAEIAPQLATHFSLAGEALRTVKYALVAAESFIAEYGWGEAVRFGRLGLSTWQENPYLSDQVEIDVPVRLRLLSARAEAQGGIRSEEIDHIQAGIDILSPCLSEINKVARPLAAQVYLVLGQLLTAKQVTSEYNGNRYIAKAISIYEELGDTAGIIEALSVATYDTNVADQSGAEQQLLSRLRCVELAEALGQPLLLAKSLSDLALHYLNFDSAEADPLGLALRLAQRAVGIAGQQNAIAELDARLIVSWVRHHSGHYAELPAIRDEILALARRHGQTIFEAEALTDIAHYQSLTMEGRESAESSLRDALEYRMRIGRHAVHDRENLAAFLFRIGRFAEAADVFGELLKEGDAQRVARAQAITATLYALDGQADEAAAALGEAERALEDDGKTADVCALMLAYAQLGQRQKALSLAEEAQKTAHQGANRGLFHVYRDTATCLAEVYLKFEDLGSARKWIDIAANNWSRLAASSNVQSLIMYWEHRATAGQVAAAEGRRDEAASILEEAGHQLSTFGHYRAEECRSTGEGRSTGEALEQC